MGHVLRLGISFCEVSERLLFLDVVADRYFCLGEKAERAFRALVDRRDLDLEMCRILAGLVESGILVKTADNRLPTVFHLNCTPSASLLDAPARRVGVGHLLAAMSTLAVARLSLRFGDLHAALQRLAEAKSAPGTVPQTVPQPIYDVAAAFEWTARVVRSHDQCLSRSIAVARRIAALGLPADLVIGVRLRPFAAHCWVQAGGWLVNDRIDTIRTYTPILSV